jgi:D-methionine transport system substrate-binding protein
MKKLFKLLISSVTVLVLAFGVSACGSSEPSSDAPAPSTKGTQADPVKIGVVGAAESQWDVFKQGLAATGTFVDIVDFEDYTQANPALSRGELDINEFQHLDYLAGYNNDNGDTLQPIGATGIFPIGLYPNPKVGVTSVSDIKDGDQIVVPNDETNGARALYLLEAEGLIKLNNVKPALPTAADVDKSSKVKVTAVDPAETAQKLSDPKVVASVINNDFVKKSDVDFESAIASESPDNDFAKRYINIFVVTQANVADPVLTGIVNWATTYEPFLTAIVDNAGGAKHAVLTNTKTVAELQTILTGLATEKTAAATATK